MVERWSMVLATVILAFCGPRLASGDTITLNSGDSVEGVIERIEAGQVSIAVNGEVRQFDVREIDSIDFNTPHLPELIDRQDLDHFLVEPDVQDMVRHGRELRETAAEIEALLNEIRSEWESREPIPEEERSAWEETKEEFYRPVSRYQELLNDVYFHVLAHLDEYNRLMTEASGVYVGVEGLFNVGSGLIPGDLRELPVRSYLPANWYDSIFYDGYFAGYFDGYEDLEFDRRDQDESDQ